MFDRVRVGIDPSFTCFPNLQDIALTGPMTDPLTFSGIFCEIRPSGEHSVPPLVLIDADIGQKGHFWTETI
jgi:hypothetical protein